ncbi:hypothetical protein TWF718_004258 [Orbilia javanica]|uniref:Uncharacterized protein n=1 Tax=Orbilia javanica TaxID=47235 RepID=A0AAN8RFD7_9PEZI
MAFIPLTPPVTCKYNNDKEERLSICPKTPTVNIEVVLEKAPGVLGVCSHAVSDEKGLKK